MTTPLNLIHLRPDLRQLLPWAHRHHLVVDKGQGDLGYAFHAALAAVWGTTAPQPFRYRAGQGLLAYSTQQADTLHAAAELATPDVAQMLGLDSTPHGPGLLIRPFPKTWKAGQILGFEVRIRPIVRKDTKEWDAFLSASIREPDSVLSRESVYREWLSRQLGSVATLLEAQMTEFRLADVIRQTAPSRDGSRQKRPVSGPDAVFSGVLQVRDEAAFATLVARGIGRHRAFGYGMLLLKPPSLDGI